MGLTRSVLTTTADSADLSPQERIERWESVNAAQLGRAQTIIDEVRQLEGVDLASMSVALRVLRGVIRAGSAT
jgi:glutamate dehydrogenase